MLERVTGSGLNEALKHLLVNVIKTYFVLTGEDAERYGRLIERKEFRAVQEVELTWADKLIKKGREKGLEAGVIEGKRKAILRQLSAKFGEVPESTTMRVEAMSEADLDSVLDRILTATSLDGLRIG
jgi:predicted transposase YdaD